ncbi:transglycosylase SLT domain-containing protein [Methylopila sp. M107]|uniref:transglycosylase SLT domain-containing protein n=1 Tax=Methylopila sp. M107 TaxID=1101190 RepID=UPI00037624FA|nr:transglycosylase SLT domain-containing protein [Methylopila sp. M107]
MKASAIGLALLLASAGGAVCAERGGAIPPEYAAMVARHAQANGVPEALVHRIIMRESRYNPKARNGPYWGMMQMSVATARGAGFRGSPSELLDAETNLRFGVRYLAGAYKTARGDHGRAVGFYARGYYYDAKRQGLLASIGMGRDGKFSAPPPATTAVAAAPAPSAGFEMASVASPAPAKAPTVVAAAAPVPPIRTLDPKAAAPVMASVVPAARPVPVPPVRGAAPAPVAVAAAVPVPPARVIDPKVSAPVMASVTPVPRPRVEPVSTGSIAARGALSPRSGATTTQVAAAPAPIAGPAIPLPTPRDEIASVKGKIAPGQPQSAPLAYAAQARTEGVPPIPAPRGPVPPTPPRR